MDEGEVGPGELVVSGREATVLLEAADQSLDDISLAIGAPIHHPGPGLGPELRDDRRNAATAEMIANPGARVAAVTEQRPWPHAWSPWSEAPDRSAAHQVFERGLLMAFAGSELEGDRPSTALAPKVELAAEAATRPPERLVLLPPFAPAA